jgi:CheY-like chemotaxis protein
VTDNRVVLLVDDDPDICRVVTMILEDESYQVICATNGQEALDYLRGTQRQPALILLDLMLPVVDAWQFRAQQWSEPLFASIPIVVFSANSKIAEHARTLDAVAFIKKPPDLDELLKTVERTSTG